MFRVLVANREEFDARGIAWLLHSSMTTWETDIELDSSNLAKKIEVFKPDLIVLELEMISDKNFTDCIKVLSIMRPSIIALTMEATFSQAKRALELGASDLLLKPIVPKLLLKSAQIIYRQQVNRAAADLSSANSGSNGIQYSHLFQDISSVCGKLICFCIKIEDESKLPLLNEYVQAYSFKHNVNTLLLMDCLVCFTESNDAWRLECNRFLTDWKEQSFSAPIAISIQSAAEEDSVPSLFRKTLNMLKSTFYLGYWQIIITAEEWRSIDPFLTPEEQRNWVEFLNKSDVNAMKAWLYEEFLQFNSPYPDPGLVRIRLTSILAQIRRYMKTYKKNNESLENLYHQLFQKILYGSVVYSIIEDIILFISTIVKLEGETTAVKLDPVEKILSLIELNYHDPGFTLETAAELIGRNPNYLSTLLYKKRGKHFREILNEIRIDKSVHLLLHSTMKISEIAQNCGFNNQQYFNKVFKKMKLVAPSEFRKKTEFT